MSSARNAGVGIRLIAGVLLGAAGASVLALYLRYQPETLVRFILFGLILLSCRYRAGSAASLSIGERVTHGVFSALLSLAIVLGYHIQLTEGLTYSGTVVDNYISPYGPFDLVAFAVIAVALYVMLAAAFLKLKEVASSRRAQSGRSRGLVHPGDVPARRVALYAVLIFALWIPYLLTYWPGFIFGDSTVSLSQAVGGAPLANQHPVVYTLFIKVCIRLMERIGLDITWGCGLYSICQMSFMAICFGYMATWLEVRTGWGHRLGWILAFAAGISHELGGYSVAMWKDPMFSAALMAMSLLVFDIVQFPDRRLSARSTALLAALAVVVIFLRSNGLYVIALVVLVLIGGALWGMRRRHGGGAAHRAPSGGCVRFAVPAVALVAVIAFYGVVTGPLYRALGVYSVPTVESVGVPLNQMARVAALDGSMSERDREYMDELLTSGDYRSQYRPTCTDMLKWSGDFNGALIDNGEFWERWASMLVRNPITYLEAWELQTCGFWTVNVPLAVTFEDNIESGVPRNFGTELQDNWNIQAQNLFGSELAYDLFPYHTWSVPVGIVLWTVLYLALCLILLNVRGFAVSLLPVLGLLATLLIASPIWYWPRYGAAAQFLIPFYVFLLAAACGAFRKDDAKARDPLPQAGTETGEAKNRHASL